MVLGQIVDAASSPRPSGPRVRAASNPVVTPAAMISKLATAVPVSSRPRPALRPESLTVATCLRGLGAAGARRYTSIDERNAIRAPPAAANELQSRFLGHSPARVSVLVQECQP